MSIEKKMEDLTAALNRVADLMEGGLGVQAAPAADKPAKADKPAEEKPPELEYTNHAAAKVALMEMLAELKDSEDEPEAMRLLLAPMGVKKMSSVSIETLSPHISKMEGIVEKLNAALEAPAEETTTVVDSDPGAEVTLDEVKAIMGKIVNNEALGMEVVKNIVSEFGVKAIKDIPAESLTAAYEMAEATLATAEG